jgi:NAD(P)-dependent dehydrogenase (short-subunit alcohol dehydrogenase family)
MVYAHTLAEHGAHVILADIDQERCNQCAEEISKVSGRRALGLRCDVANAQDVQSAMRRADEAFGRIDILINNAAAQPPGFCTPFEEYSLEVWDRVMAVNLTGPFLMARAVAPVMLRQKSGSVINICSTYGVVGPNQHIYDGSSFNTPAVYSASKAGILGLTRYLATYWAEKGIRVNSITPGGVFRGHKDPFLANYCERVPMARMGEENELRGAVVYLASDASSYVTGHNLVVDGGWTIW